MRKPKTEEGKQPAWKYRTPECQRASFDSEIEAFIHAVPYSHDFTKNLLRQTI